MAEASRSATEPGRPGLAADAPANAGEDWGWRDETPRHTIAYLLGAVLRAGPALKPGVRVLDVGCGNGHMCAEYVKTGATVVGFDISQAGVEIARRSVPGARFEAMAIRPDALLRLGEEPFDIVLSTEVVEHLYAPEEWARCCFNALRPGGTLIATTPHHGYLKNLVISLTNKWDAHWHPAEEGGHIKFWSERTLGNMLREIGFAELRFSGAGRVPMLWKSMVVAARRPTGATAGSGATAGTGGSAGSGGSRAR
ncbi:MAG TPA: SAM-dependent methyltransferase [Phycisphaerales bacterium]|nr:SAM-dependent methyltransferase [Phycisphaerales bacterium]